MAATPVARGAAPPPAPFGPQTPRHMQAGSTPTPPPHRPTVLQEQTVVKTCAGQDPTLQPWEASTVTVAIKKLPADCERNRVAITVQVCVSAGRLGIAAGMRCRAPAPPPPPPPAVPFSAHSPPPPPPPPPHTHTPPPPPPPFSACRHLRAIPNTHHQGEALRCPRHAACRADRARASQGCCVPRHALSAIPRLQTPYPISAHIARCCCICPTTSRTAPPPLPKLAITIILH